MKWYYGDCNVVEQDPIRYECINPDAEPYEESRTIEVYTTTGTDCEKCDKNTGEPL